MRCDCIRCRWNESRYCAAPSGDVEIDENGECNMLWLLVDMEDAADDGV